MRAQEVIVGEPIWVLPGDVPDEMAKPKNRLRPDYPKEMRSAGEIGYVIIRRYLAATGESRLMSAAGTHMPFQRSVEAELPDWTLKPARRNGQPMDGPVWVPVIFNPPSASAKADDATPRLLAVKPVFVPHQPLPKDAPPVVRMHLSLDETGGITRAVPEIAQKDDTLEAITQALKEWKFAPARKAGQPVAAELIVLVICEPPLKATAAKRVPPKALSKEEPEYPYAMRAFNLEGRVQIEFDVDVTGKPQNFVISQSSNPGFDEPALEALRKWTFQPATVDGKPVKTRMRQELGFRMGNGRGDDAFSVESGNQKKIPEEWRHDTAPRIRGVQIPVYPYALRVEGVRGKARATMLIDPRGRVVAVLKIEADRPEFGLALTAALEGFQFDPALRAGQPVKSLLNYEQKFSSRELGDEAGDWLMPVEKNHPERIVGPSALDSPLKPISRRAPRFPVMLAENVTSGKALIECLIDKDGRARLPRIVEATDPAFGYAAIQALATWWFEPPKAQGKEVVVRVRVPFEFSLKDSPGK